MRNNYTNLFDTQDYVCSISPREFELFCLEILEAYAKEEGLKEFHISHDKKLEAHDGEYQIDVYATFKALGTEIKVLCECKQYSNKVKRDVVQLLDSKLKSLGMHKGILLSTSGFQKGAIEYAQAHGIALIQVFDHSNLSFSHSDGPNDTSNEDGVFSYLEKNWPKYRAICSTDEIDQAGVVYPTTEMVDELYKGYYEWVGKTYGINRA